jgi:hypothetical protein
MTLDNTINFREELNKAKNDLERYEIILDNYFNDSKKTMESFLYIPASFSKLGKPSNPSLSSIEYVRKVLDETRNNLERYEHFLPQELIDRIDEKLRNEDIIYFQHLCYGLKPVTERTLK